MEEGVVIVVIGALIFGAFKLGAVMEGLYMHRACRSVGVYEAVEGKWVNCSPRPLVKPNDP